MESEQATPVNSIKDVVRRSVLVPESDKHLKKAGGHIGQNVVEITIEIREFVPFIKSNSLKVNTIAGVEFKFVYYDIADQRVSYQITDSHTEQRAEK